MNSQKNRRYSCQVFGKKVNKRILLGVVVAVLIIVFLYLLGVNFQPSQDGPRNNNQPQATSSLPIALQPGSIGEPAKAPNGQPGPNVNDFSQIITSTIAEIKDIKSNGLIVLGSGSNFSDGQARDLICNFTDETYVFLSASEYYQGKEGFKHLKEGMRVLIGADENIRGKTEFIIKTINLETN